jgi:FixJ family two-component response regulator
MDPRFHQKRARPTVYLVDDDAAVRRALAFALDLEGFAVEAYESGEALLSSARPQAPGCLVLDERLPGASGLDTLRQLRARQVELPAIFITSHPKPAFRQTAARVGVPIVEKPLEGETLIAVIHRLLGSAATAGQVPPPA